MKIADNTAEPLRGLSRQEAEARRKQGLNNRSVASPSKSVFKIIFGNIFTYFNLIFSAIALILILTGSTADLTFYIIAIVNTLICIVQELHSKHILNKLTVLSEGKASVLRDGELCEISAEDTVLDDTVLFSPGNQIYADAVVLDGVIQVNESLVTGESDEITKKAGDRLLSGSYVVSGNCYAKLVAVGKASYVSKLTLAAKTIHNSERSEMIRTLNKLLNIVGIIIIPLGILMFCHHYFFLKEELIYSIRPTVAAILGMIPEGLFLLASVAFAVSVVNLAKKQVLVHDMKCVETLARVDVLCVDKTGTITDGKMRVCDAISLNTRENDLENSREALGRFVSCMSSDNATMAALKEYCSSAEACTADRVTSFSSVYKYSSACFGDECFVLGAPEFILRERYGLYREEIEQHATNGLRALVFASYNGVADGNALTEDANPLLLVLLENPIRDTAVETFGYLMSEDVKIKVISGDNPITASNVAAQAGIADADKYIDMSTVGEDCDYGCLVSDHAIFGRVTPEQKSKIVRALKGNGHTVAMTGDGVNDILALKEADCSIAMGSGSDAAAKASQLVLLDSDFSRIPSIVFEGRRVVNNIQRSSVLFLVKNIFSLLMSIMVLFATIAYPLEPTQITLISFFTIGAPTFLLAFEPNTKRISGSFLKNVFRQALPAGLTDFAVISALVFFCGLFDVSKTDVSTACALLMAVVGFLILIDINKPLNKFRATVIALIIAGFLLTLLLFNELFDINRISLKCVVLLAVFSIIALPVMRFFDMAIDKLWIFFKEKKQSVADKEQ